MILLELAAQGVRGVSPAGGRATLRPGYNVVASEGATLRRLVEALLHPDARDADALPRTPGGPPGAAQKAGLTFVGDDRITYRLVRDLAGGCQLHRFDPAKRSFALVSQDLAEIARLLRAPGGAPPPERFAALLSISAAELPSRQAGAGAALPGLAPRAPLSPEQARKRIGELEKELERARVAEKLQTRQDALQARLHELEDALRQGEAVREGLEKAEAERHGLAAVADAAAALGDPEARIAAYEKLAARAEEARARVEAERGALDAAESHGAPPPPWRQGPLWYGVGAGALALGLGLGGAAAGTDLRYAALLDVPAFGFSAWVALRWVGALEAWERIARKRRVVDDWERKFQAQFEKDSADVKAALAAAGVAKVAELREQLGRLADADAVVAEWRQRSAAWEADPQARGAIAERAQAEAELRELEAALQAQVGGFVRDVRSIEHEIRRLEQEASSPPPAPAPPPRPAASGGDPIRGLLERAAAALGQTPMGAGRAVQQKASQAITGLSFQRLGAIAVDDRGNVSVQHGGRPVAAASLPAADRDLVWLALKLALLEQALAAGRGVAVLEDAFAGLSDGARRFAARLLKQIARPGQVVHATADPAFREAADHAA